MTPWIALMVFACGGEDEVVTQPDALVVEVDPVAPPALDIPQDHVPQSGEDIGEGGLKDIPDPNATRQGPGDDWDPISVPQGRREGGVKWEGVKSRSTKDDFHVGPDGSQIPGPSEGEAPKDFDPDKQDRNLRDQ